jgi:hypothetical protein
MPQTSFGQIEIALDAAVYFVVDHALVAELQDRFAFDQ